jgi:hypothetical protein
LSLVHKIAAVSLVTSLVASLTFGLTDIVHAQKKPAGVARKPYSDERAIAVEAAATAAPCDKDTTFCPTRPCSQSSVLCIDASDNAKDDNEKSYLAIIDPKNAELAKIIFENPGSDEQWHEPPKGEFYSFVTVKNQFEDGNIIRACADRKTGSFTLANIAIDYKGLKGSSVVSFVPLSTLFIHANSVDVAKGSSTKGCTFKSASRQTGPYILHSAPVSGQQEYTLHLKTTAGFVPAASHFAMFAKLATSAAGVWPGFITVSQPAGTLITTVGADLDQISAEAAVTSNIEYSAVLTTEKRKEKKDAGLSLQVWSPRLGSKSEAGFMEVSQRRSASIAIDSNEQNEWIAPEDVLSNSGLGSPHRCITGSSFCDKEQTFAKALNTGFALYGDFTSAAASGGNRDAGTASAETPPQRASAGATSGSGGTARPKSGAENWSTVFETCEKLRTTAGDLGLTAIDSLLVRWALVQRAKLIDVLRDYQNGTAKDFEKAIKAASRVGQDEPYKQCWDAAIDDKRMRAIEAVMGKKFSPAIPEERAAK